MLHTSPTTIARLAPEKPEGHIELVPIGAEAESVGRAAGLHYISKPVARQACGIDIAQRIVCHVGITIPRLRVAGIDSAQSRGIGRDPAALPWTILAVEKIVQLGKRVFALPGEIQVTGNATCPSIALAIRSIGRVVHHGAAVVAGGESRAALPIRMQSVLIAAGGPREL